MERDSCLIPQTLTILNSLEVVTGLKNEFLNVPKYLKDGALLHWVGHFEM